MRIVVLGSLTASIECFKDLIDGLSDDSTIVGYLAHQNQTSFTDNLRATTLAESNEIPVLQFSDLEGLEYDLGISLMFDRKLPAAVVCHPHFGWVNIHLGPLPRLRGSHSALHAVRLAPIEKNWTFSVTMHFMDESLDTGPIIDAIDFSFETEDTAYDVYVRALSLVPNLFERNLKTLLFRPETLVGNPQTGFGHRYSRADLNREVDLDQSPEVALAHIRSLSFPGKPGAYTLIGGKRVFLALED